MNIHTFKGMQPSSIDIDSAGDTWRLTTTATITSFDTSVTIAQPATNTHLIIDGRLFSEMTAVISEADGARIEIGKDATIVGVLGVFAGGDNVAINNHGLVTATSNNGLTVMGDDASITNSGRIIAPVGLAAAGDLSVIVNAKGGIVESSGAAVQFISFPSETEKLVNHGQLSGLGGADSVSGNDGKDIVQSDGQISGDMDLFGGDDVIDLRGGTFRGSIYSGSGNDTLWTDTQDNKLKEDAGSDDIDQVKSTVSYHLNAHVENLTLLGGRDTSAVGNTEANLLTGNAGNNSIHGGAGADIMLGGRGNDRLFGDDGSDQFIFTTGGGRDLLEDFEKDIDQINVIDWKAIQSMSDLRGHAHDHGADVVIEAGHDSLVIHGLHKADLARDDFLFAA